MYYDLPKGLFWKCKCMFVFNCCTEYTYVFVGKRRSNIGDDLFRKRVEENHYLHGECIIL